MSARFRRVVLCSALHCAFIASVAFAGSSLPKISFTTDYKEYIEETICHHRYNASELGAKHNSFPFSCNLDRNATDTVFFKIKIENCSDKSFHVWNENYKPDNSIIILPGDSLKYYNFDLDPDNYIEENDTFTISIYDVENAELGKFPTMTIVLIDDDSEKDLMKMDFNETRIIKEGENLFSIVNTTGKTLYAPVIIEWEIMPNATISPNDISKFSGSISSESTLFCNSLAEELQDIEIIDDTIIEPPETFTIHFYLKSGKLELNRDSLTVTVIDNDSPNSTTLIEDNGSRAASARKSSVVLNESQQYFDIRGRKINESSLKSNSSKHTPRLLYTKSKKIVIQ